MCVRAYAQLTSGAPAGHVRSPEDCLDPGDERPRVERLRHVVVGAELEADDRVDVVRAGREHEDRRLGPAADLAADLEPVALREHEVEDHEVGIEPRMQRERLVSVECRDDPEALLLQVQPKEVDDVPLVVDDEDRFHGREGTPGQHRERAVA